MTYFVLPKNNNLLLDKEIFKPEFDKEDVFISKSLFLSLSKNKSKIEDYKYKWDTIKKYVNPYEYIHSVIPGKKCAISKYKPISRSYYKLIEIYHTFELYHYLPKQMSSFHLAEGPGGFMEAIAKLRDCSNDKYTGITLLDQSNSPGWKLIHTFLRSYPNIFLEKGSSKDGNILLPENLTHCFNKYKSSMDLITADGGFDFSLDYNKQEINSSKLIFAEIAYGLLLQKKRGIFIIKIYDSFLKLNVDLLYLLTILYNEVIIFKPYTSRCANSEKYIVCKTFKYDHLDEYYPIFLNILTQSQKYSNIYSLLDIKMPLYFFNSVEEANIIFGAMQIDWLNKIISHIKNNINKYNHANLKKCVQWCIKYNIEYNNIDDMY